MGKKWIVNRKQAQLAQVSSFFTTPLNSNKSAEKQVMTMTITSKTNESGVNRSQRKRQMWPVKNPVWPANFIFYWSWWPVHFQDLFWGLVYVYTCMYMFMHIHTYVHIYTYIKENSYRITAQLLNSWYFTSQSWSLLLYIWWSWSQSL